MRLNGTLSEEKAAGVMMQLLLAIEYMHGTGVIHRDLKLSNILLSDIIFDDTIKGDRNRDTIKIKICDFGLAIQLEHPDEEHFTLCGTPNYIAPEVAMQKSYGPPVDLWSVGCLFYSMVVGVPPFERGDVKETLRKIVTGEYEEPSGLSSDALNFLKSLLDLDQFRRANVFEMLNHPFLMKRNISKNLDDFNIASTAISMNVESPDLQYASSAREEMSHQNVNFPSSVETDIQAPKSCNEPILNSSTTRKLHSSQVVQKSFVRSSWLASINDLRATMTNCRASTTNSLLTSSFTSNKENMPKSSSSSSSRRVPFWTSNHSTSGLLAPFTYSSQKEILIYTNESDVTFCCNIHIKGQIRQCRLCVKSSRPLDLLFGYLDKNMQYEVDNLISIGSEMNMMSDGTRTQVSPSLSSYKLLVFSDNNWLKRFSIYSLPKKINIIYMRIAKILDAAKSRLPKIILYITPIDNRSTSKHVNQACINSSSIEPSYISCKCMLMCNAPLPDFRVQWSNGTTLLYSLQSGQLTIDVNDDTSSFSWSGCMSEKTLQAPNEGINVRESAETDFSSSDNSSSVTWANVLYVPHKAKPYLSIAQKAMTRCLTEESKLRFDVKKGGATAKNKPVIIVHKLE